MNLNKMGCLQKYPSGRTTLQNIQTKHYIVAVYMDAMPDSIIHLQVLKRDRRGQRDVRIRSIDSTYRRFLSLIEVLQEEFNIPDESVRIVRSNIIDNAKNN